MKHKDYATEICKRLIAERTLGHDGAYIYKQILPFFWMRCQENYLSVAVRSLLRDDERDHASTNSIREGVQRYLQTASRLIIFADSNSSFDHLLYINNGVLDLRNLLLYQPESIGLNFRYAMDFSYIQETEGTTPYWNHFLNTAFADDHDIVRLREFICCLVTGRKPKTAFFLFGPSNSGKSVFAEFIGSLIVPPQACTAVGFDKFNDSFFLEELSRGRLNVVTELSQECFRSSVVENFKKIVAHETMTVSRKYHDPCEARFNTILLSCSNKPPRISPEDLDAVTNRMEVLIFPAAIPKNHQIPNLKELLYSERDVIISQALQLVPRLEKDNYTLTQTASSVQFMYQLFSDSPLCVMKEFFSDCMILQQGTVTPTADVIKAFKVYSALNGLGVSLSNREIIRFFMSANPVLKKKHRVSTCKSSVQCFMDITLQECIVEALYAVGESLLGDYCYVYHEGNVTRTQKAFYFTEKPHPIKPFEIVKDIAPKIPFTFNNASKTPENNSDREVKL